MLAYRDAVDNLYSHSVAEFTRRQDAAAQIEARTKAGRWGTSERERATQMQSPSATIPPLVPSADGDGAGADTLGGLRFRLAGLEREFRKRVNVLLGDLSHQPDTDMRFLGVVMNFNNVYEPVKRRGGAGHGHGRERERVAR